MSVVAVHGLWMRGTSMLAVTRRLEARGYRGYAFNYPSVRGSLEANAAALAQFVDGVPGDVVHLVGHSLGGVLIRTMLERGVPVRLGRVVCLGSPLRGSRTAARLARLPGGRWLVGKALMEHNARGGFDNWSTAVEVGSIAGRWPFGVGRVFGPFPEPNDGTVAVAETELSGLRDHVVLPVSHVALLWSTQVTAQMEHFLAHGRFFRTATDRAA
jgi:pimeloyl-ACP methyl ester carboxylesterase